ncbi:MAG: CopD family protein [Burkholderiaceae bacterium]|nr:CopD family protein [Burkholderiaceae bacterium]
MPSGYLWVKALHIVFVTSWFAGLFYLPRIYVNLAMVDAPGAERDRLLLMAGKLWRFMQPLMALAVLSGLWLWLGYGVGRGSGWMHAKLAVVLALLAYHYGCGRLLRGFQANTNRRPHRWFRWFNELPVLALLLAVVLVVVKPF